MSTSTTENGRGWLRWLGLAAVPLLVAGLLVWGVGYGGASRGTVMAAVVNDDQPVTIQGQVVPLGRQLAGLLVGRSDEQFRWVLTSSADARRGLDSGDYRAVVTVPPSFSQRATSAAASNDAAAAAQGVVSVTTARDSALADGAVAQQVVEAATTALNAQVVQTYLDNVYLGFNTLHTELGKASDGAAQLAAGAKKASTGARQLSDGAVQLDNGSGRLASGAQELSDGLADARRQTADLPAQARRLAAGARQVADGNQQLADQVVPVADAALKGIDALPSLGTTVDQFTQLADRCPRLLFGGFCSRLDVATGQISSQATQLGTRKGGIRGQIVELRDGVSALADGSGKVADGTQQLADAAPQLANGIARAATGARQLADGAHRLNDGSGRLATGAGQLSDGVSKVHGGLTTLADGLAGALSQIPTFTPAERSRLAKAVTTPTMVDAGSTATARLAGSLFLVLALWLGAMATFASRRPVHAALASSQPTWRLFGAAARSVLAVAAVAGSVLGVAMAAYLRLGPGRSFGLIVVAALIAMVFALVNQALVALLGNAGVVIGLVVAVVTAIVGISSTSASALASLARLMPTQDAGTVLRAVTIGGGGLASAVLALVVWAGISAVGYAWAIERQRTVPLRQLRPTAVS
jgi:putative membrane protein